MAVVPWAILWHNNGTKGDPMNKNVAAHKMVRQVAVAMAIELYEELMKDNEQFAKWKKLCPELTPEKLMKMWVRRAWPTLIDKARATLATMLTQNHPEHLKEAIADALIKDKMLRAGRIQTVLAPSQEERANVH